jgi:hypothetical protein
MVLGHSEADWLSLSGCSCFRIHIQASVIGPIPLLVYSLSQLLYNSLQLG